MAAVEETLKLYHAWLGYLLTRQGEEVLRVGAGEIRGALEHFSCSVSREGEEYVIRVGKPHGAVADVADTAEGGKEAALD